MALDATEIAFGAESRSSKRKHLPYDMEEDVDMGHDISLMPSHSLHNVTELTMLQVRNSYRRVALASKPPAESAQLSEYAKNQEDPIAVILDGRYSGSQCLATGLPVQLYHPAFAKFCWLHSETGKARIPKGIIAHTANLLGLLTTSNDRRNIRRNLSEILDLMVVPMQTGGDEAEDLDFTQTSNLGMAVTVIVEISNMEEPIEIDPTVKLEFMYRRLCALPMNSDVTDNSCCPVFLISIAGHWLTIMGATFNMRVTVQRLHSRWYTTRDVLEAARTLFALKLSIAELKGWYSMLSPTRPPTLNDDHRVQPAYMFPHFTYFREDGEIIKFKYIKAFNLLPGCTVFLAYLELEDSGKGPEVVVKFVDTYDAEAHRYMASLNFAPRLLHCGDLGEGYNGRMMVVMEKLNGKTLSQLYGEHCLPPSFRSSIGRIASALHEGGYIFPDFRTPNMILLDSDSEFGDDVEGVEGRLRLVDFDWACKEGDGSRYSGFISETVMRSGATPCGLVERKHQDRLIQLLFDYE